MLISKYVEDSTFEKISELEKKYDIVLCHDYKDFLMKYNGGETPKTNLSRGKVKTDIRRFYGDFLTDILANYKIDKYHLKMQRKNQFVKISFYELVLFWSNSANLKLSVCFIFFITFIGSPSRDSGCHRS